MFPKNLRVLLVLGVMWIHITLCREIPMDENGNIQYDFMLSHTPDVAEETNLQYLEQKVDDEDINGYVSSVNVQCGGDAEIGEHARLLWG